MKFVKLSIVALSMSLFVVSCGSGSGDAPKVDSSASSSATTTTTTTPPPAAPVDTMNAGAAKPADTAKPAAAPASTTETKTTTKTTEKTKTK